MITAMLFVGSITQKTAPVCVDATDTQRRNKVLKCMGHLENIMSSLTNSISFKILFDRAGDSLLDVINHSINLKICHLWM